MTPDPSDAFEILDLAWDRLESDHHEAALEVLQSVPEDVRERWVLEATILIEVDEVDLARSAIERAIALGDPDDPELSLPRAEIELRSWNLDLARELFEAAMQRERQPSVLARLALIEELQGNAARADELIAEAAQLDPEAWASLPRMSDDDFEEVVEGAITELPQPFREALVDISVVIQPVPQVEPGTAAAADTAPDVLGLFVGASRLEQCFESNAELPATIYLYQRNLERASADEDHLIEEIRTTLFHEVAHYLGFDEEEVDAMGLG